MTREAINQKIVLGITSAIFTLFVYSCSKTNANKLWTTGTAAEKKMITDDIAKAAVSWQIYTGLLTWVDAWMPSNYNDENNYSVQEQAAFSTFMSCQLKANNIPYAVNSDTKFYDRTANKWVGNMELVVDAFIKPVCN